MASRNIAITEELYRMLMKRKLQDESFTKVIYRLLRKNERPSNYFGAWGDLSIEEKEKIEKARNELRKLWFDREIL